MDGFANPAWIAPTQSLFQLRFLSEFLKLMSLSYFYKMDRQLHGTGNCIPIVLIVLAIWLAGVFCPCAWGQSNLQPQASFQHIEILPDQTNDGLHGIALRFDMHFTTEIDGKNTAFYALECRLMDENGLALPAATGAKGYCDLLGDCRDSMLLYITPDEPQVMFSPYFALGLPVGSNHIKLQLQMIDMRTQSVIVKSDLLDLRFQKPPMKLYRMRVEKIESYTTDADGETWDYKFLNARDIYPELIWSLRRGHFDAFESPKQKNDTIFTGTSADLSPWIWLSEGDQIHFLVRDFDLLGNSDLVGRQAINIWEPSFKVGQSHEVKFERVKRARIAHEALLPPRVVVTGFEAIENEKVDGITGLRIRMDYIIENEVNGARFLLATSLHADEGCGFPEAVRIIGPGAVPFSHNIVELTAQHSSLELFVPHFALPHRLKGHPKLQLEAGTLLDAQPFALTRVQRPLLELDMPVTDIGYGQWKIGTYNDAGRGGIQITMDYELPEAYFRDLPNAEITLEVALTAPWGQIDPAILERISTLSGAWEGGRLRLTPANRQGSLDLFLPYSACAAGGGPTEFTVQYATKFMENGQQFPIGEIERTAIVDLPALRTWQFGVREASVIRRQWILSEPNMYWELWCGSKLVHCSKVVVAQRHARWSEDEEQTWTFAPTDDPGPRRVLCGLCRSVASVSVSRALSEYGSA